MNENSVTLLHDLFLQLMREYRSVYARVIAGGDWKNSFRELISKSIPEQLISCAGITSPYTVVGSYGKGRWTSVPWIAVFDTRITSSAQQGVYIVYLLNKDTQELYLTLEAAATEEIGGGSDQNGAKMFTGIVGKNSAKMKSALAKKVGEIRPVIANTFFSEDDAINSGSTGYDYGAVCYKKYTIDDLPSGEVLLSDFKEMLMLYAKYVSAVKEPNIWWPSETEYSPGFTKDQWLEILNNPQIIGPVWGRALAMFYTEKEGTTCTALGAKFGENPASIRSKCMQLGQRIYKETGCPVVEKDGKKAFTPILFLSRNTDKSEQGSYIWKLRPELYDALTEFEIEKYLPFSNRKGIFDSWEIIDENTAIKTCDKSFFEHNGSGIPKDICWFFGADQLDQGEAIGITLQYEDSKYNGRIVTESSDHKRVRLLWNSDLGKQFLKLRSAGIQKAIFKKAGENIYNVSFQNAENMPLKTWLLSWNPAGWNWVEYHDAAKKTQAGEPYEDSWTCASTKVQPGDRVFLTVLGTGEKNGIIASGFATRGSYEDEHWDPEKAAQGKKAKRIDVRFDWIADYETDLYLKQSRLKELFPNQEWSPMGSGISIQDQYVSQLEDEWKKIKNGGGEEAMSVADTIANIKAYIAAAGFTYENGLIENFYLSLKSKPFVILAGTSGTGKTRLVKLFAEAIGATGANGRYQMVSVRPDWSDSTDLFGHVDLNSRFIPGAIIDFVKRAELDIEHPYILCLDEMNLARVEYYLSDILSVVETRDFDAFGSIVTDPLIHKEYYGSDTNAAGKYGTVRLPENLYIVGTVNMDETTFPFSKKVLDRANTIEFSHVDLTFPSFSEETPAQLNLPNGFLKTRYLLLRQCMDETDVVSRYCAELEEINKILTPANAHVGYRVRDEIVFYLLNNHEHGLLPEDVAMDNEIMQKILPRIQGSSASVKNMLCELFKRCASDFEGYGTGAEDLSKKMLAVAEKPGCKYRNSARKIADMVRRFEEDGFTSYWL